MLMRPLALCLCYLVTATAAVSQVNGWEPLFDGKTLAGWNGNEQQFRVHEGAIVAGTLEAPIERDEFLCTDEEFSDFELRLEARMTNGQIGGVQFRGQRVPNSTQVGGYQADMGFVSGEFIPMLSDVNDVDTDRPYPLWGSLLDEYRTDRSRYPGPDAPYWLLAVADRAVVDRVLMPNGWNQVLVRAVGPSISISLNGVQTVEYVEPDQVRETGEICLQIHSGPPSEAHYRDIAIRKVAP